MSEPFLMSPSNSWAGRRLQRMGRRGCECLEKNEWQDHCSQRFLHGNYRHTHSAISGWKIISYSPLESLQRGNSRRL